MLLKARLQIEAAGETSLTAFRVTACRPGALLPCLAESALSLSSHVLLIHPKGERPAMSA